MSVKRYKCFISAYYEFDLKKIQLMIIAINENVAIKKAKLITNRKYYDLIKMEELI